MIKHFGSNSSTVASHTRHSEHTLSLCNIRKQYMRTNASVLLRDIVISARTARPKMMSNVISTDRISAVEDPRYLELIVIFYSPEAKNKIKKTPSKSDLKVVMPKDWTPIMYLGVLYQ
jgi:hypothetical protein